MRRSGTRSFMAYFFLSNSCSQHSHQPDMRINGLPRSGIIVIGEAKELALLPHYFAQGCIVDMADLGEEVMLDLEIQATHQPGNDPVTGGKVGGGPDLMDGPFGTYDLVRSIGHIERSLFDDMRQLKYYR